MRKILYATMIVIFSSMILINFNNSGWANASNSKNQMDIETIVKTSLDELSKISTNKNTVSTLYNYDSINEEKIMFRLLIQNNLNGLALTKDEIIQKTIERKQKLEKLINKAADYGVTITEQEVTEYIDKYVAPHYFEEQEEYAKSLGLSLDKLNYEFDRDLYYFDALSNKLLPKLFEEKTKLMNEDDNSYYERIINEFYNQ